MLRTWEKTTNDVTDALQKGLDRYNPIYMMADWRQSEGAMIEYLVARQRRMRIFLAETFDAHASVESKTEQSHETEA